MEHTLSTMVHVMLFYTTQSSLQSIEKAISLKISRIKAAKKEYSFNDLRDLESKLALIRGRSTKGAAEMDRFLNVTYIILLG